jgi:hypothetical protein
MLLIVIGMLLPDLLLRGHGTVLMQGKKPIVFNAIFFKSTRSVEPR